MTTLEPTQPWRDAIAEALPDSSGRELASWQDPAVIVETITRLIGTGHCFAYGGTSRDPANEERAGMMTGIEVVPGNDGGHVLVLQVDDVSLRLRKDGLRLNFIPHPADTADAGFLLSAVAADVDTHAWNDVSNQIGAPCLQLVLGEENGLLIGAARSIHVRHPMYAAQLIRALTRGIYRPGDAERLKYEAQAKQLVKADYEQSKGPRRSGAMDQADVDRVAWALLQHGLQPTIELLREIHGSGSPSALHPKLKVFYSKLVDEYLAPVPPPAVPEPVRHIWNQLVEASRDAATGGLKSEIEALTATRARVEAQEAALAEERTAIAHQLHAAEAAAISREAHIRHLEAELAKVQDALAQAQHTIAGDADLLAEARTELRQAREQRDALAASLDERTRQLAEAQRIYDQATAERDRLSTDIVRLTQSTADQSGRLHAAEGAAGEARHRAERLAGLLSEVEARRTADQKALQGAGRRIETLIADYSTTKEALSAVRAEMSATRTQGESALAVARQQLEQKTALLAERQAELVSVRAEHQAMVRERDRLDALLARLGAVPAQGH